MAHRDTHEGAEGHGKTHGVCLWGHAKHVRAKRDTRGIVVGHMGVWQDVEEHRWTGVGGQQGTRGMQ